MVLPSSVKEIDLEAFKHCEHLWFVDLRAATGLKRLGYEAFAECENLRTVLLNDGLEAIGGNCFAESGLEEIAFPSSVKYIESSVFQACKSLKRVTVLGDGLEIIGQEAFAESGIESFVAPPSLRELKELAF